MLYIVYYVYDYASIFYYVFLWFEFMGGVIFMIGLFRFCKEVVVNWFFGDFMIEIEER